MELQRISITLRRYAESLNTSYMNVYCIVNAAGPGDSSEYCVEQRFTRASRPGMIRGKPVCSLEAAKAQGEDLWLANSYRAFAQFGISMPDRVFWDEPSEAESSIAGIICVLRCAEPGSAPVENDTWKVWYKDLFDLDCPTELEAQGEGLKRGLVELWIRYLHAGVNGLSRFYLSWKGQTKAIEIESKDRDALLRLRRWVFYLEGKDEIVERKKANFECLVGLAACHARLIHSGQTIVPILHLAKDAPDAANFMLRLAKIGAPFETSFYSRERYPV